MNYLQKKKQALLNYVSSGGRLPSEYQQVEWICNDTKNEYIITDVQPQVNDILSYDMLLEYTQGTNNTWFTGWYRDGSHSSLFGIYNNQFYSTYSADNNVIRYGTFDTNKHRFLYNMSNGFWIDDTQVSTSGSQVLGGIDYVNKNIHLFHRTGFSFAPARAKLYEMKIYINGNLEFEGVPCYRKADDVIGLYDLVYDTFYTNSGSGTFTKGNDV